MHSVLGKNRIDIQSPELRARYQKQLRALIQKLGRHPREKTLYHITTVYRARRIARQGFRLKYARTYAFGRGVNLCERPEDCFAYVKTGQTMALLVCRVVIARSHPNSSDVRSLVRSKNGSLYSKPKFMRPKKGFDAMYCRAKTKIWVIPATARVFPLAMIILRSPDDR